MQNVGEQDRSDLLDQSDLNGKEVQAAMIANQLADYAKTLSFANLPQSVVHEVKRRVLDVFGCAYGALTAPPSKIARRMAATVSVKRGARIWGTRRQTTSDWGAFANGSLVRYLDCNDTYLSKEPAHPSDNIPACLAVAEEVHANGKRLIEAIVLAYEVQCRLCDAAALRPRGWDHVTYGAFSVALAVAKLLRLSKSATVHAINLAGVTAGALRQTRVGEVSFWKACAFANAARNGIVAAHAAREGMTGPSPIFEGEKGFQNIISGPLFLPHLGGSDGNSFKILDTYIKSYPLEYHAQSAVEGAFSIRRRIVTEEGTFDPTHVTAIEVGSFDVAIEIIGRDPEKWCPKTRETADHSLPYCVAIALLDGKITPYSFSKRRLTDHTLYEFMQKVVIHEVKAFTSQYPVAMPTSIRVTLLNGQRYDSQVDYPKGHPCRPMTDYDIESKFHALADRKMGHDHANKIIELVGKLDTLQNVGMLTKALPVAENSL